MNNTKKIIILISILIFLCISSIFIWGYIESRSFSRKLVGLDNLDEKLPELEARFNNSPKLEDCGNLIEGFYLRNEFRKAIGYAEKCLDLEQASGTIDWFLHFHLADLYNKVNELDLSKHHLIRALELDEENRILKYGYIEKSNLEKIYTQISIKPD